MNPHSRNRSNEAEKRQAAKARQKREGGIVTRFGNYYTPEEWAEMQAGFEQRYQEAAGFLDKMQAIKEQAMSMIEKSGLFTAEQLPKIRAILENPARAQFTSEKKREAVEAASQWFHQKMSRI